MCLLGDAIENIPVETNPYSFNHIQIVLNPIINELLENEKLEKYCFSLGLLNKEEQKIIHALRERNFTEITLKLKGGDDLIIEITNDINVIGEKAVQLKKILGLNKYDAITIKHRNDKEVYVQNKKRLN